MSVGIVETSGQRKVGQWYFVCTVVDECQGRGRKEKTRDGESKLTCAALPIPAVARWAGSTDEGSQRVVTAHSREARLGGALIYILSTRKTWRTKTPHGIVLETTHYLQEQLCNIEHISN